MRPARAASLTLLAGWVLGTALLPRAATGVASALVPLPSRDAFVARVNAARTAGPDGHNPKDEAVASYRQRVLAEYGVDEVYELPLNFDGLAMQVGEEFADRVWDEHYGELKQRLNRQIKIASVGALLNPFQAIDQLSMSIAGTDLRHDLAFQDQVERFRRDLIAKLNHEHAYGGSRSGEWSWKASPQFYAAFESFEAEPLGLPEAIGHRSPALLGLALWSLLALVAVRRAAVRLETGKTLC